MEGLELAKFILESPAGSGGTLRESFLKAAKARVEIPEVILNGTLGKHSGVSPEVVEKIDCLRECEKFSNIGWFNYTAWNALPEDFKLEFALKIDPLMWNGVYFNYAKFLDHKDALLPLLEPTIVVSLLKVFNSIEFKVVSSDASYFYGHLSISKMKKAVKFFKDRLIISFTVDNKRSVSSLKGEKYGDCYPT